MSGPGPGVDGGGDADRAARVAVAGVVRRMAAERLGRGLAALAVVFVYGAAGMVLGGPLSSDHALLGLGAVVAGGAMLLYGNGAVRRALGHGGGRVAAAAGLVPYGFALYLLGFRGLRPFGPAGGDGPFALVVATAFVLLSTLLLWDLTRLTRLHALARTMTVPAPEERP